MRTGSTVILMRGKPAGPGLNDPARVIGLLAAKALVNEVCATPKPGLVDRENSGAHTDMDLETFLCSARAIAPYLMELAWTGFHWGGAPAGMFPALREIGRRAEEAMLGATGDVNTHKGAIFSVGVVCAAAGLFYRREGRLIAGRILRLSGEIASPGISEDFARMRRRQPRTHGERIYRDYQIRGIRGEVADGFPSVREVSLPVFRRLRREGVGINEALARTLLHLIAEVPDTNVLHRAGPEALAWARERAREELERDERLSQDYYSRLMAMDREFTARNISPGGCADLLSVTFLADALEQV